MKKFNRYYSVVYKVRYINPYSCLLELPKTSSKMYKSSKNNPGNLTQKGKDQLREKTMKKNLKSSMTKKQRKRLNSRVRAEKKRITDINSYFDTTLKAGEDEMSASDLNNISPEDLYEDITQTIDNRDIDDFSKRSKNELDFLKIKMKSLVEKRHASGRIGNYKQNDINTYTNYELNICPEIGTDVILDCKKPFQHLTLTYNDEVIPTNEILPTITSTEEPIFTSIKNVYDAIHPMKFSNNDNNFTILDWSRKMEGIGCEPFHNYNPDETHLVSCHLICRDILVYSLFQFNGKNDDNKPLYKWLNYCFYNSEPPHQQ